MFTEYTKEEIDTLDRIGDEFTETENSANQNLSLKGKRNSGTVNGLNNNIQDSYTLDEESLW